MHVVEQEPQPSGRIALRLTFEREKANMSKSRLGSITGYGHLAISHAESGSLDRGVNLRVIAEAIGFDGDPASLLDRVSTFKAIKPPRVVGLTFED